MKKSIVIASMLGTASSFAATNVGFFNFEGTTRGVPIVDNTGTPIDSASLTLSVGVFEAGFIDGIGALSTTDGDQAVIDAFTATGTPVNAVPATLPGVFNSSVADADSGNTLLGQSAYLLISDNRGAPDVIVIDLGATFPEQDASGAGKIDGRYLEFGNVLFGETDVPVNTSSLEALNAGFATGFERGVAFGPVVPEPSTSILASLAGLALLARRRR